MSCENGTQHKQGDNLYLLSPDMCRRIQQALPDDNVCLCQRSFSLDRNYLCLFVLVFACVMKVETKERNFLQKNRFGKKKKQTNLKIYKACLTKNLQGRERYLLAFLIVLKTMELNQMGLLHSLRMGTNRETLPLNDVFYSPLRTYPTVLYLTLVSLPLLGVHLIWLFPSVLD